MPGRIDARLAELGLTLPDAPTPAANYVPFVAAGGLVFISGQVPKTGSGLITGKLGADVDVAHGQGAAKVCALNLIAQMKAAAGGDLDRVKRVVKLTGFVNSAPDFPDHPKVVNGCSDVMVEVFGDQGRHARSAVACPTLPLGVAVEIDGIFEIDT